MCIELQCQYLSVLDQFENSDGSDSEKGAALRLLFDMELKLIRSGYIAAHSLWILEHYDAIRSVVALTLQFTISNEEFYRLSEGSKESMKSLYTNLFAI